MRVLCALNGLLVVLSGLGATAQTQARWQSEFSPLRIALLPFEDGAGFQGDWNLAIDVPVLLGQYLSKAATVHVVPMDSVLAAQEELEDVESVASLGRYLEADIVIVGRVDRFGMRRFTAGDPNLIGYKSYSSQVALSNVRLIKVATGEDVDVLDVSRKLEERPLGLDLFGRPRQQDKEFRELFSIEFASDRFFELQLGELTAQVFGDLSTQIIRALIERPPIDLFGENAKVLSVEENEVFLGIGSQNNVEQGDVLPLYDQGGGQVALVEVNEVLGSQLCKALVVERDGAIEPGFGIGQRVPPVEFQSPGQQE